MTEHDFPGFGRMTPQQQDDFLTGLCGWAGALAKRAACQDALDKHPLPLPDHDDSAVQQIEAPSGGAVIPRHGDMDAAQRAQLAEELRRLYDADPQSTVQTVADRRHVSYGIAFYLLLMKGPLRPPRSTS